jgi:hypothetical protein
VWCQLRAIEDLNERFVMEGSSRALVVKFADSKRPYPMPGGPGGGQPIAGGLMPPTRGPALKGAAGGEVGGEFQGGSSGAGSQYWPPSVPSYGYQVGTEWMMMMMMMMMMMGNGVMLGDWG